MPDIIQTLRDTYASNPAAALNMLGDTVYLRNFSLGGKEPFEPDKINRIIIYDKLITFCTEKYGVEFPDYAIGKTVFLTREAAEKRLESEKK